MPVIDTLPSIDDRIKPSAKKIKTFRKDGHVLIPGILSADEAAVYRQVILDAAEKYNTEKRKIEERDTYGKAFLQIMNLWQQDAAVKKFTLSKRFAGIAADLLGVSNVRIYHDQALFKEPGADQHPGTRINIIGRWIPLIR